MNQFYKYILTLVAILMTTTPAWAATATLGAKKQNVTADGITFSLGGSYTINNILVDYSYTGSGKEASLSWTVPTGYTISVSQITINAKNDKALFGSTGKGHYKTSKNGTYTQFCNANSWNTYTLNSSSYFPLGNGGSITLKAVDRELQWKDIVFTYTKTAHKYNIAFNANGGTGTTQGISNVSYDTDVKLTPNGFTRNKFTITYDANGGTCATAQEIRNYTFAGWAETSTGNVKYSDQQVVRNLSATNGATVTLYAKWNEPNATITLPIATKEGAVLEGWYLGETKIGEAGDTYTPTSSVTLTAKWIEKYTPEITGSNATMLVGNTLPNAFTFKNTFNPTAVITTKSISDIRNGNEVITYDAIENEIIAHNAGIAEIYFYQAPTTTIEEGYSATYTITVNKRTTDFEINFANEYFVDDEINKNTFFTNSTNGEVAIQVSDKTADNRALFTYNGSILKANGATLNANSETTTITVTQPETYKWTGKTLTKEVLVKKYPTDFSWLLKDTYYVEDVITDIFTKTNNSLPTTITSSDPNIVKVEGNQLVALNAGKATITISQATDRKWVAFTQTKEITVLKHDIVATINPNTAYWNELVSNPFSATSTHPVSGQVTPIDQFNVEQQGNEHIALMDATTRDIQTYYTNGQVNFLITRDEDYKYNALNQTRTLTVNANESGCYILNDSEHYEIGAYSNSDGVDFTLPGIGDMLTFQLWKTNLATQNVNVYGYNKDGTQILQKTYSNSSISTNEDNPTNCSVQLSEDIVRIKIQAGGTLNKHFKNLTVTRAQYLRPTDGELALSSTDTLKLPTVAVGQPSSKQFKLKWSACTDIKIVWSNPKFTINTTDITTRDGSLDITVSCNTSEVGTFIGDVTIYNQEQKETFPVICEVYTKWLTDSISGSATHSMKVDEPWETDFYFPIQRASQYPTTDGAFHYAIEHTFVDADLADRNPNYPNEVISYNNGVITAHNAGTAILTIKHEETAEHFESQQFTCTLTVSKHDVERIWNDPVYFNDTIYNYFTTSNTVSPMVIESQTDTDVAKLTNEFNPTSNNSLDLITFNKETSTTVTVSQAETYHWKGYSEQHIITPIDPNNHVTFTIDSNNKMNNVFKYSTNNADDLTWDNGIRLGDDDWVLGSGGGDKDGGYDWSDKYIIIEFTGIPDTLYLTTDTDDAATNGTESDLFFYISEGYMPQGATTPTFTQTWEYTEQNNDVALKLNPNTRFVKLCYTGNLRGWFKGANKYNGVTVTELNQFEARPDTLDFGTQYVDNPDVVKTFDFHYANAGYKVNLKSTDSLHFTVSPTYIDTIGGEKYGTIKDIQVTYHPNEAHNTSDTDAMILIWDEIGNKDTVFLTARTIKSKPTLYWTEDWSAKEPIVILNQHMPDTVAKSTNGYKVKYRSDDESILKIAPDSLSFIAVGIGETYITAHADSDRVYLAPDTIRKLFHVTDKQMQYIVWEDNLTDLCVGDNPIPLTAQVWVMTDAANNTWEYSPEQTAKLQYTSPNTSVVSVTNNMLYIHGKGELLLEASVPADGTYEMARAQVPVRVYDCSIACTDADLVIPIVGMQLEDELHFDPYQTWDNEKIVEIDTSKGIPGNLTFTYRGVKEWTVLEGKIRVFESTDGGNTWNQVLSDADAVTPEDNTTQYSPLIPLSPNATHIKFERFPNEFSSVRYGSHYVQFITVLPAHYIKTVPDDIHFGNVYVGNSIDTTINVLYSSIRSDLQLAVSENHLSINKTTIIDECGAWDTVPLKVSLRADAQIIGAYHQYVTIKDPLGEITDTVHVYANVIKNNPTVTWNITTDTIRSSAEWETKKTAFASSGAQVFYEVTEGNQMDEYAYLNDNGKMILLRGGTITARAYIKETSVSNEVSKFHDFFIIVDPLFEDTHNDHNWLNDDNWNIGRTPWDTDSATIQAGKNVILSTHVTTQGLDFQPNSSIQIATTGGLSVGAQGIKGAATDGSSITIDNLKTGAGFLRISPEYTGTMPKTTVRYQTRSTLDTGANKDATWQYIGAPGADCQFTVDYITWLYQWSEPQNWINKTGTLTLEPFAGYAITQYGKPTYELIAEPINTSQTITLTKTPPPSGMEGNNLFANSYMAPIDVKNFTPEDFSDYGTDREDIVKTFYIFNSGSWNDWNQYDSIENSIGGNGSTTPGQYCAIPALSAPYLDSEYDITTIPPMQGVYVIANSNNAAIYLNYEKHVWQAGNDTSTNMNEAMRAPHRPQAEQQMQQNDFLRLRIQVNSANSGADRMYIIQDSNTTSDYDNGYDAPNQFAEGMANIYTTESFGKMEVSCSNNIDSMYIGFQAGNDSQYTLTFSSITGDSIYLKDLSNDTIFQVFEDGQYQFTAQPLSTNDLRFQVLLHPINEEDTNNGNGGVSTDIDNVTGAHIWHSHNHLYISNAPANSTMTLYNINGQLILSTHLQHSTHTIDLGYLQKGVYILQLGHQMYKFVCQ